MSLDFGLNRIKDWQQVCFYKDDEGEERMTARCDLLIWATMVVHLSSIKKANIDEWLLRLRMFEKSHGCIGTICAPVEEGEESDGSDGYKMVGWKPTREELEQHIGLWTNVAPKTRAGFKKTFIEGLEQDARDTVRRDDEKARKAKEEAA